MTVIDRNSFVSPDTNTLIKASQIAGELFAGEPLLAGAPCFIDITDGLIYLSGNLVTGVAAIHGYTARDTGLNQPVTLYKKIRLQYVDVDKFAASPGAPIFLGLAKGTLDDAATGGTNTDVLNTAIGFVVTPEDIFLNADNITDQTPVAVFP